MLLQKIISTYCVCSPEQDILCHMGQNPLKLTDTLPSSAHDVMKHNGWANSTRQILASYKNGFRFYIKYFKAGTTYPPISYSFVKLILLFPQFFILV